MWRTAACARDPPKRKRHPSPNRPLPQVHCGCMSRRPEGPHPLKLAAAPGCANSTNTPRTPGAVASLEFDDVGRCPALCSLPVEVGTKAPELGGAPERTFVRDEATPGSHQARNAFVLQRSAVGVPEGKRALSLLEHVRQQASVRIIDWCRERTARAVETYEDELAEEALHGRADDARLTELEVLLLRPSWGCRM